MPTKRGRQLPATNGHDLSKQTPVRSLLKDQAYAAIKGHILRSDLGSGAFLAERQLAAQLQMSKTPIRAALERLEAEGFVTISPQQGIIVRDFTIHEIADQYETRVALETYVLRAVSGKLTSDQIARLQSNLAEQDALRGSRDFDQCVVLDAAFHMLFCEFLGNAEILRIMGQLREKIQRVITRVFHTNSQRFVGSVEEHRAIAEAVIGGDGGTAAKLIELHLEYGKQSLLSPRRGQVLS